MVERRALQDLDIETVRFALERELVTTATALPDFAKLREAVVPSDPTAIRRRLLAAALRLTPTMAPSAYQQADEARRVLGIVGELELYQSSGQENAALHLAKTPILLEIQGRMLSLLDPDAGVALFGHELGHYLAHGPWTELGGTQVAAIAIAERGLLGGADRDLVRRMIVAREVTADRVGMLAAQDLDAALRLDMIATTGLSGDALTWDTAAYLAQSRELMEATLAKGESAMATTHPEHSLRAWAMWLFSETDVYQRLTGAGPGSRKLAEVDAAIAKVLGAPKLDFSFDGREEPPPFLNECALASAVLVAAADGEICTEELDAIEDAFSSTVAGWSELLDPEVALDRFYETGGLVRAGGPDLVRRLFVVLTHVMGADDVVDGREIEMILAIGEALGYAAEFRRWIRPVLEAMGAALEIDLDKTVAVPLPVRKGEVKAALEALCESIERRGESVLAPRRLLRIIGAPHEDLGALDRVSKVFDGRGIEATPPLSEARLDDAVRLLATRRGAPTTGPAPELDASRTAVIAALTRLRDELVSGDGRSPAVRLRRLVRGRTFDLAKLDEFHVGAAERALTLVTAGRRAPLVTADDAGKHDSAKAASEDLRVLDRAHRDRKEETGANDLYLGYPLVYGSVAARGEKTGYAVRAPLVLHPVELVRDGRGARGFSIAPRTGDDPIANQSLIRLIFNKAALALPDELGRELDEIAADPARGTKELLDKLREVGIQIAAHGASLGPFRDRDKEIDESPPFLAVEECALLGLFPQSSSDLLQDYDALLRDLAQPDRSLSDLLAAASGLLPDAVAPTPTAARADVGSPVVAADPSQREAAARCSENVVTVVDGPPGTGKSQLIVNLVADALRRGERVAVVAEKRAALDVVHQRLDGRGLGHATAIVHDVNDDRRPLFQMIHQRLEAFSPREFSAARLDTLRREYGEAEKTLQAELRLHGHRPEGTALTIGQLLAIDAGVPARIEEARLADLDRAALHRLLELAERLYAHQDLWGPESWWRTRGGGPRGSLQHLDDAGLARMRMTVSEAVPLAERFEALCATDPVDEVALIAARDALGRTQDVRKSCADPGEGRLLVALLASPNTGVAELASCWSEASTALARWTSPTGLARDDELTRAVLVLRSYAGRLSRFFSLLWWKTRGRVRAALATAWPEEAAAGFDAAFLDRLKERLEAARVWTQTTEAYARLELPDLAPKDGGAAKHAIETLTRVSGHVAAMTASAPLLTAIGSSPPATPGELTEFSERLGRRVEQLRARDELREHTAGAQATMPWLASATATDLRALVSKLEIEGHRLRDVDGWMALADEVGSVARDVLDRLALAAPHASLLEWREAITRAWAVAHLQRAGHALPQLADAGTTAADHRSAHAAETLRRIEPELRELEVEAIAAQLDRAELLCIPAAAFRARRTPKQKAKEAILKEVGKKSRLMPLRRFVRDHAAGGLLEVVPCWLVSPETMAVLFPREPLFDLVIFDEASQCTVESGLPVMLRARRVVIAGDEKQMPPTSFFKIGSESTDDEDRSEQELVARDTLAAESLLALARNRCPHIGLTWHYRCREEELIAFSNHAMYEGQLLTIPSTTSPEAPPALRWVHVDNGEYDAGLNRPEAERVVTLIDELLRRDPRPTIGVVTFNLRQRKTILDAIDARGTRDEAFATLWAAANDVEAVDERPFVKNLESVQGDERDIIVFSLGHAPAQRKRKGGEPELYVPARFGPLGQRGGERRLNVAISRAKLECHVVASFDPKLLHVGDALNDGPRLFKAFLDFAHALAHGRRVQADRVLDDVRGHRLESRTASHRQLVDGYTPVAAQIALALEERGFRCELGMGTSQFRIPLAVAPTGATTFRLAVMADEGTHETSAFERHVHHPTVLHLRGWDVLHVTPATWTRRPQDVLDEITRRLVAKPSDAMTEPRRSVTHAEPLAARV